MGPDSFGGAIITLNDVVKKTTLASGFTNDGNSGTRTQDMNANVTPYPIITPEVNDQDVPPVTTYTINWVEASPQTVMFPASFNLNGPTLVEVKVQVPLPPEQGDQVVSQTHWITPGVHGNSGPGLVVVVPGLWVQPEIVVFQNQARIRAKVTMMCGCEINDNSPWLPGDFTVFATITGPGGKQQPPIPLKFEINSQFAGLLTLPENGNYQVVITANQLSTTNSGSAQKNFSIG